MGRYGGVMLMPTRFGATVQFTTGNRTWARHYASLYEALEGACKLGLIQQAYRALIPLTGLGFRGEAGEVDTTALRRNGYRYNKRVSDDAETLPSEPPASRENGREHHTS